MCGCFEGKGESMLRRVIGAVGTVMRSGRFWFVFLLFGACKGTGEQFSDELYIILYLGDRVELDELHPLRLFSFIIGKAQITLYIYCPCLHKPASQSPPAIAIRAYYRETSPLLY